MARSEKTYDERFAQALDEQHALLKRFRRSSSDDEVWRTMRASFDENLELSEGVPDQREYWLGAIRYCDRRLGRP